MTALKPIENRRVRGVASERYPLNDKCAHPECGEPAVDPHHIFPRSLIGGDSWFVEIQRESAGSVDEIQPAEIIPHVSGLCRAHHDDVEGNSGPGHSAWIRLEDGEYVWYDRSREAHFAGQADEWALLGPLNPQPGSREGKPKRRKFKGEAKRKRKTISLRVPDDAQEDGAGMLDDACEWWEGVRGYGDEPRPKFISLLEMAEYAKQNYNPDDF